MIGSWEPKAVIYDLDGVLINSEPLWKLAEIKAFAEVGLNFTAVDCEQTVGLRIDEVVTFWFNKHPWQNKTKKEVVENILRYLIVLIEEQGEMLPGVIHSLDYFKSKNIKIGLATSSYYNVLNAVLKKLDISSYFDNVRSAEEEEYGKPHPAVYLNTATALEVLPEDCLVVEDSYNGMLSGLSAKMKVLVVPEKSHEFNEKLKLADYILDSLKDIETIFK